MPGHPFRSRYLAPFCVLRNFSLLVRLRHPRQREEPLDAHAVACRDRWQLVGQCHVRPLDRNTENSLARYEQLNVLHPWQMHAPANDPHYLKRKASERMDRQDDRCLFRTACRRCSFVMVTSHRTTVAG